MNVVVLGAGAWGTALAMASALRPNTLLWAPKPAQAEQMRAQESRFLSHILPIAR